MIRHDWAWHEARIAEPHPQAAHHDHRWLAGKRAEMAQLDDAPEDLRAFVHEHNANMGFEMWRQKQLAEMVRCRHGKQANRCGHCALGR